MPTHEMKRTTRNQKRIPRVDDVAIHQAGHAVIACLMGIPFSAVTRKGIHPLRRMANLGCPAVWTVLSSLNEHGNM